MILDKGLALRSIWPMCSLGLGIGTRTNSRDSWTLFLGTLTTRPHRMRTPCFLRTPHRSDLAIFPVRLALRSRTQPVMSSPSAAMMYQELTAACTGQVQKINAIGGSDMTQTRRK